MGNKQKKLTLRTYNDQWLIEKNVYVRPPRVREAYDVREVV